jgi:VWFA-related protein
LRSPAIFALLLFLFALPSLRAQSGGADSVEPTLRVGARLVNVIFSVHDKHGGIVSTLGREDFLVTEDGVAQKVKFFKRETDLPLTLALMIDTSGSQARVLGIEQDAGAEFLRSVLRPKDMALLLSFDVNVNLEQDYTSDVSELRSALRKVRINTGGLGGSPGMGGGPLPTIPRGTLLYDAVFLAADEKLKSEMGRKAMVILTDGEDQGSQTSIQEAIEAAQKADVICYVIEIEDNGMYNGFGMGKMKQLAEQTGGRVLEVGNRAEKLRKALEQISGDLRSQYSIGYTSTNKNYDGKFRRVELKTVSNEFKVQARKGYYAPKQ